jgi:predicted helicase
MLLTETGYKPTDDQRFRIFLTNSLEEAHPDTQTLFSSWLSDEADQANAIKRDAPVMVVMGNPPYSGESSNKGEWIMNLMEDYKKEPGGKEKLKEQNSKFINDDYVKFMRFGQHFIDKNGSGILAFINPHGFLDNPTFRGMRWNLLKTYDKIYTIDLHGNSKKNETAPDGSVDQNVFDIMQGVSINFFIKSGIKKDDELGKVFNFDLYGNREFKYNFLSQNNIENVEFNQIQYKPPMFYMVHKNLELESEYEIGFSLNKIFNLNSLGLLTKRDRFITDFDLKILTERLSDFLNQEDSDIFLAKKYELKLKDNDNWDLSKSRNELFQTGIIEDNFRMQNYRCFDKRVIYYDKNFVARLNTKVLNNLRENNYSLISTRQLADNNFRHIFVSKIISDQCFISNKTKEGCQVFPLYLYPETTSQTSLLEEVVRVPNLNMEIVSEIAKKLQLDFVSEKPETQNPKPETVFAPIDILDYIYAVLHAPNYREKYKEFLKIDFPRVPYPKDATTFWKLVTLGSQLRQIHLLESDVVEKLITQYPEDGNNVVVKPQYKDCNVYINELQYFANVPEVAWNFYIGGYQPAQKWLKDRKGRELNYNDILHYQKIIVALTETDLLMKKIDKIEI